MKRLGVFLGLTLLLTTTSCNILSVSEGGIEADKTIKNLPSYEIVYSQKISPMHNYLMAACLNEEIGIIGAEGDMYYSNDQFKTWQAGEINSHCIFGVGFLDENHIWGTGNLGMVRYSENQGRVYKAVNNFEMKEKMVNLFIDPVDEKTLWCGSCIKLGYSLDGGETWQAVNLPRPDDEMMITGIQFITKDTGYIMDEKGILYYTQDAGTNWTAFNKEGTLPKPRAFADGTVGIYFESENRGTIALLDDKDTLRIFYTEDGGRTFTKCEVPDITTTYSCANLFMTGDGKYITIGDRGIPSVTLLKRNK